MITVVAATRLLFFNASSLFADEPMDMLASITAATGVTSVVATPVEVSGDTAAAASFSSSFAVISSDVSHATFVAGLVLEEDATPGTDAVSASVDDAARRDAARDAVGAAGGAAEGGANALFFLFATAANEGRTRGRFFLVPLF